MSGLILIRGGGDLATGVALRLHRVGLDIVITELPQPLAVRRSVSFAEALYEGEIIVEGVTGCAVPDPADILKISEIIGRRQIPVLTDPLCSSALTLNPVAIVDARMMKQPPQPLTHRALLHIGLGPGFTASRDCQAVIETQRGHTLGRVIWDGSTAPDTFQPDGDPRRVLRAPASGIFTSNARIGDNFQQGELIATINAGRILAPFGGILRGLLRPGLSVTTGMKVGDLDARNDPRLCRLASDKALAVGGGVLEALLADPRLRPLLWS
jgi:xanthine dehydrogenase accessory factor